MQGIIETTDFDFSRGGMSDKEFVLANAAEDATVMERVLAKAPFLPFRKAFRDFPSDRESFVRWFVKRKMAGSVNRLSLFDSLAPLVMAQAAAGRTGMFQRKPSAVDRAYLLALTGTLQWCWRMVMLDPCTRGPAVAPPSLL